jgi:hypothetical protein
MKNADKKQALVDKINTISDEYYFDIHSMSSVSALDESHLIKLVSKLAVGVATVWWTAIELKDYINLKKKDSKIEESLHDILSGKNTQDFQAF